MSSVSLPSLVKIESYLEAAEELLVTELPRMPVLRHIRDLISEALQRVTTERLRLEHRPSTGA